MIPPSVEDGACGLNAMHILIKGSLAEL